MPKYKFNLFKICEWFKADSTLLFCDYCDVYLTHDSMSVRKAHNSGRNHLRNVVDYYQQIGHEKAQSVIDSITSSYAAEGQTAPGAMLQQSSAMGGFGGGGGGGGGGPPFGFHGRGGHSFHNQHGGGPHGGRNMPHMPFPPHGRGMPFPPPFPPPQGFPVAGSPGQNGPPFPPPGQNGMPPFPPPGPNGMPPFMPPPGMQGQMNSSNSGDSSRGNQGPPGAGPGGPPGASSGMPPGVAPGR